MDQCCKNGYRKEVRISTVIALPIPPSLRPDLPFKVFKGRSFPHSISQRFLHIHSFSKSTYPNQAPLFMHEAPKTSHDCNNISNIHTSISSETPTEVTVSGASGPPGFAATATIGHPWNLTKENLFYKTNPLFIKNKQKIIYSPLHSQSGSKKKNKDIIKFQ